MNRRTETIPGIGVVKHVESIGFVVPGREYHMVELGRHDWLNGPTRAAFPTREAAEAYAAHHQAKYPERDIRLAGTEVLA